MKKIIFTAAIAIMATFEMSGQVASEAIDAFKVRNVSSPAPGIEVFAHDGLSSQTWSHPYMAMLSSGGTEANPTPLASNKVLGAMIFSGHDGSSYLQRGRIQVSSLSSFNGGASNAPVRMDFNLGGSGIGQNRMSINGQSGFVGIGSLNPDERLTVKGKIHAEEVRVDLNVPADYVFESYYTGFSELKPEYTMPTLAEVEAYTKENNHLPEMPSAKEIQEEGLYLSKMANLLLQKVEELTLYTIEQEKRIKALEAKLAEKE